MQKLKSVLFISSLLLLIFVSCDSNYKVVDTDYELIRLDSNLKIADDSVALEIIAPYKQKLDSLMSDTIAYASKDLTISLPEGIMNNFVADLLLERANNTYNNKDKKPIDFCMINIASLRKNIGKGAIKRADIFELMPFENKLVVLELAGADVKLMLDYIAKTGGLPVSGLQMGIKSSSPVNVLINGKAFNKNQNYIVLTYDYLANGGDDMTFLTNPISRQELNILGRDAIIDFIIEKNQGGIEINSSLDNRIYNEE
ncbi:MAG: 5'-nucleotidase C-terminal domain-containing protein [Saprospiraceae bacterium]|nr:5'-nucleotidase C-terminal domain-containing protein [Saprospiraceae bacterium]